MKKIALILTLAMLLGMAVANAEISPDLLAKAEQGDAKAQYDLAKMYKEGRNTPIDYQQATKWFVRAKDNCEKQAQEGNAEAQFILSEMYKTDMAHLLMKLNAHIGEKKLQTEELLLLRKS